MTATEIRQSFLDFFKEKQHTIVPSASLLPQSPGLLFTNAGMNQFVPYFLGTQTPSFKPHRAADTQKCIRAGGKHNDLDDVGYDTYHHTMFEMLGNWSFGDYFKEQAIAWAWELIVERWGFPAERLYATVYAPDKKAGDPSEFDQESYDLWAKLFESKGLDPKVHVVNGDVKDNFWKMGDTGPCGPCSELHVDLTPKGDSKGSLVNKDSDLCIEIWNLVFIQYNAEADGSYRNLPATHVDTGMGFERVCSIYQGTDGFRDFSKRPSNYSTDVFRAIFQQIESLSGAQYCDIYPESVDVDKSTLSKELKEAIAFRVIADHIRTLSFSIADGILPGNTGRNYVLRRILRRAVNYGRTLGFEGNRCFLPDLVDTLVAQFGEVFPELIQRRDVIVATLKNEEESFNRTLTRGLQKFQKELKQTKGALSGDFAFQLYDTFGFPLDLTEILCQQNQIRLDKQRFQELMEQQQERARAAQESEVVAAMSFSTEQKTQFVGFDSDMAQALITEIHDEEGRCYVIVDQTPFYSEMGGQIGDVGTLTLGADQYLVEKTFQVGEAIAHQLKLEPHQREDLEVGAEVSLCIDGPRRREIEAHHTATHLLHWALHEEISSEISQQGSSVSPQRLRFDFNSSALSAHQVQKIEDKVNEAIELDSLVSWVEVDHEEVKKRADVMQFFGDKYGKRVRVVQIGGERAQLDGYAMELCGGTHTSRTSELGLFKIKSEAAIASGVRRIEAYCGEAANAYLLEKKQSLQTQIQEAKEKLSVVGERLENMGQKALEVPVLKETQAEDLLELESYLHTVKKLGAEGEKLVKKLQASESAAIADGILLDAMGQDQAHRRLNSGNMFIHEEGSGALLQELLNGCKKVQFSQAAFIIVDDGQRLHLGAYSGAQSQQSGLKAGDLIGSLAPIVGGKGGGRADQARGAAPDRSKLEDLKNKTREVLG